jgi:hypothetical protein
MADKLTFPIELEQDTCCSCGIVFAIPKDKYSHLKEKHGTFYCPNGHQLVYNKESLTDKANRYEAALKKIKDIQIGAIFNKAQLELAIEYADRALSGK